MKRTYSALVLMYLPMAAALLMGDGHLSALQHSVSSATLNQPELTVKVTDLLEQDWLGFTVKLRFRNHTSRHLKILKPVDGSESCMVYPYYHAEVTGPDGGRLEHQSRCGNTGIWYSNTKPEDYVIDIFPGESVAVTTRVPVRVTRSGLHVIRFRYVFNPAGYGRAGKTVYPPGLWVGSTDTALYALQAKPIGAR